jgi:hypothetical protein
MRLLHLHVAEVPDHLVIERPVVLSRRGRPPRRPNAI